ncbi:MAG: hypothetical protein LUD68_06450, partial [Rikenellaceae bacterium]|nr:hypothetical protein [Rikenellaceae bacterium]
MVALSWISVFVIKQSKSRNRSVNLLVTLLICLVSWYVDWTGLLAYYADETFFEWFFRPAQVFDGILYYSDHIGMTLNNSEISPSLLKVCYGIEFLVYLFPLYLISQEKLYYCEFCHRFMKSKDHYFPQAEQVKEYVDPIKTGDLAFMQQSEKTDKVCNDVPEQYKLNLHACPECGEKYSIFITCE